MHTGERGRGKFVRLRLAAALALIAILVLPGSIAQSSSSRSVTRAHKKAASFRLYRYFDSKLLPLNPQTLKDVRKGKPIRLKGADNIGTAPDGSVLVTEQYPHPSTRPPSAKQITIRMFDGHNGKQRAHFHPQDAMSILGISKGGREIYGLQIPASYGPDQALIWEVADGASGRRLFSFRLPDGCCTGYVYNPIQGSLYLLSSSAPNGLRSAVLFAYDCHSGREVARLALPQVLLGNTSVGDVAQEWRPGIDLSPDGRTIAMLDGNRNHLLLVQTDGLRLVRDQPLSEPQGILSRIGGWLGLVPTTAEAKRYEGVWTSVQYSVDGKHLYATGWSAMPDQNGKEVYASLGVRVIDANSGLLTAQALADSGQNQVHSTDLTVAPDNSALYALTIAGTDSACPCFLRRLDPKTLHTLAKRKFGSYDTSPPPVYTLPG